MRIVVMGPSGSGKSTVAAALAQLLEARYIDADDLHPRANVEKMAAGTPLTDSDRMPWLKLVGQTLASGAPVVVACSALKRSYRDLIRAEAGDTVFVELVIGREALEARMRARTDHFMPASLLESQIRTLQPLQADEDGIRVDGSAPLTEVTDAIAAAWAARGA